MTHASTNITTHRNRQGSWLSLGLPAVYAVLHKDEPTLRVSHIKSFVELNGEAVLVVLDDGTQHHVDEVIVAGN